MIARSRLAEYVWAMLLFCSFPCFGQVFTESSYPLAKALDSALEQSSLTGANAVPFHIKVHLFESTNPQSPYHADIEEYWVSSKQWRRTIDSEKFQQTLIIEGGQVSEQNVGEYYPLWLRNFVTGIFDPVPDAERWDRANAKISQIRLPDGSRSEACAHIKDKIGSGAATDDAVSSVCFDKRDLLKFVGSPGYSMGFSDYKSFGPKLVPRRYENDPEPGTTLVAEVTLLEELKKPDAALFSIPEPTAPDQQLKCLSVDQATIERLAQDRPAMTWPQVRNGKTSGVVTMYISVDRQGRVREAYPLNADNAGLQDAVRDQLLQWRLKPLTENGVAVQAEAALTFQFATSLANAGQ